MAFEIVPAPHLPPYVCMACGCANGEPHVFIPHNQAWEQAWPFICKPCVAEMAGALSITKAEPLAPAEVSGEPTAEEVLRYIREHRAFLTAEEITGALREKMGLEPAAITEPEKATCPCGAEFTGPTAKAKLGSHQRTCTAFHERAAAKFAKEGDVK